MSVARPRDSCVSRVAAFKPRPVAVSEHSFSIDLGPDGPGVYRLLRAGKRSLVDCFVASVDDPEAAQQQRLTKILANMKDTAFGKEHGLGRVKRLADLPHAAPIRTHAELLPWLERVARGESRVLTSEKVQMLLETSGTTGKPKHLPCTRSWAKGVADAQAIWVLKMVHDHPEIQHGQALTVVSPQVHTRSPGGLPIGSNTGRMHGAQPWWIRRRYPIPDAVYALHPSELKWYTLLRFALQADISSITTANPSTLLLMSRLLQQWRLPLSRDLEAGSLRHGPASMLDRWDRFKLERRLRRCPPPADFRPGHAWPLRLVNCWKGGPAGYFVERLPRALGGELPIREVGITASEGYFAIPLGDDWPGGVMWSLGHVLEFVGDDGQPRFGWQLEVGEQVRLVITTEAGLFRYDLADTLEVVGRVGRSPVLRFVGKSGRWLNATGEKVTGAQVSRAVATAALGEQLEGLVGFSARIRWGDVPVFELAVEGCEQHQLPRFAAAFDRALRAENIEYEAKRDSARLGPVAATPLPDGTLHRWRAARVAAGAPEGQVKDPVLCVTDEEWARVMAARA